ncbi:MAG: 4-hydroxybenzoate octaprenyltransferase [Pseudomonadales bacterium]|jgi:4-hydroxybenzoate polyprenyltransferase
MRELAEPYVALMRIDRPVGTLLLLWPTLAALWFAAGGTPPLGLVIVFTLGTWVMRSAGCVVNDIADRRFDGYVKRTAARPLATGRISTVSAVVLFALLLITAGSLLFFLNPLTRLLAVAGLGLAAIYPLMKRWTYLPQVILGTAFSWSLVMAYAAVRGALPLEVWLLFIASMTWIVAYDTMYAMVDRDDDLKIGIRSTAILFGSLDRLMVGVLQATTLIALWLFAAVTEARGGLTLAIFAIAALFAYQQFLIRHRARDACFDAFRNNVWVGFVLFAGAVVDETLLPHLSGASFFGITL